MSDDKKIAISDIHGRSDVVVEVSTKEAIEALNTMKRERDEARAALRQWEPRACSAGNIARGDCIHPACIMLRAALSPAPVIPISVPIGSALRPDGTWDVPEDAQPATPDLGIESIVSQLREIVTDQANDEGLWFDADRAPEAYLQHALRDLHGVVERAIAGLAQPATAIRASDLEVKIADIGDGVAHAKRVAEGLISDNSSNRKTEERVIEAARVVSDKLKHRHSPDFGHIMGGDCADCELVRAIAAVDAAKEGR